MGQERFLLEQQDEDTLFTITAVSRPATTATRLSGPIGGQLRLAMMQRYLQALDRH
ncbi:hypothetical protein BH23ACT6_BH23ACT6_07720 [soil metagenome]